MKNVIYCLFIVIAISACSTNKYKTIVPRLAAIGIQGDDIPQYSFHYDKAGNLTTLVQHYNAHDTNVHTFFYDSSHRITGMIVSNRHNQTDTVQEQAEVTTWDKDGNVEEIRYFDAEKKPLRTATIHWEKGQPLGLKYSDSTQAVSWNYKKADPVRKDICMDTFSGKKEEPLVTLRTARYEWDDSINPLHPLVNQLLMCRAVAPVVRLTPLYDISNTLLHLGTQNPALIKISEKEKSHCQQHYQEYERYTTMQYTWSCNSRKYPSGAWVHVHSEGFTRLGSDADVILEYNYE